MLLACFIFLCCVLIFVLLVAYCLYNVMYKSFDKKNILSNKFVLFTFPLVGHRIFSCSYLKWFVLETFFEIFSYCKDAVVIFMFIFSAQPKQGIACLKVMSGAQFALSSYINLGPESHHYLLWLIYFYHKHDNNCISTLHKFSDSNNNNNVSGAISPGWLGWKLSFD